jgi:redox-sensitive bicupin YhaK (pirin superfamily)
MEILTFDQLPQGGFAGLIERQFIKDSKIYSPEKQGKAINGIGNFVYLADANYIPNGETGMHAHKEIDVITIMTEGNISHAGSLEHGQSLVEGQAQVQRAGGEGFGHNEINPDNKPNQLLQLWVLPENKGEPAGYKIYTPKLNKLTAIYGGNKSQQQTFDSHTEIKMANTDKNFETTQQGEVLVYLSKGSAVINGQIIEARTLVKVRNGLTFKARACSQVIFITVKP